MVLKDVRWVQRYHHFCKAFAQLQEASHLASTRALTNLEKQGLVQAFEFTHELAWNVLKDYIEFNGGQILIGSKDTTREAFQKSLIVQGEAWMEMIKSRNLTSHTYNENTAAQITKNILEVYVPCFQEFRSKMATYLK